MPLKFSRDRLRFLGGGLRLGRNGFGCIANLRRHGCFIGRRLRLVGLGNLLLRLAPGLLRRLGLIPTEGACDTIKRLFEGGGANMAEMFGPGEFFHLRMIGGNDYGMIFTGFGNGRS